MKTLMGLLLVLTTAGWAAALQAPFATQDVPISSHDRVYAADQTSNTVSVIDPATNRSLGVIRLGNPVPASLSPLYRGALLVHGMGFSPDWKTLVVVSVGSNSVTLIDTSTNSVKGVVYVGRAPHEAFFTRDGGEIWVTVRGEDYVSVIDPVAMQETLRIPLANGPGMTMFSPDGTYGFVCSSFTPELAVVEVQSHRVVKRIAQVSPFCPNIAVSPENDEVWFTLKDTGHVQVFSAKPPFDPIAVLETGPITNHVNFAKNRNGTFAYVTVGGLNEVQVYRQGGAQPELVTTIPVGPLPHGVWPSGDGTRVYIALENGGAAQAIDTLENRVVAQIPIGQTTQALVYIPNAVPEGSGTQNLLPPGEAAETARLQLVGTGGASGAQATVAVNSLGLIDLLQIAASGLNPNALYLLWLADTNRPPFGSLEAIAMFNTNPDGGAVAQTIGPLKSVAPPGTELFPKRFLVVTEEGSQEPVLVEAEK
jgi:YVTN family beta-propeller protein